MKNTDRFIKRFWREIILEIIIILCIFVVIRAFDIDISGVFDGSLIAVALALPVTLLNLITNKSDKFYDEKLAKLTEISEKLSADRDPLSDEAIYFNLLQIDAILDDAKNTKHENSLKKPIKKLVSDLVFQNIEEDVRWAERIKKRIAYDTESKDGTNLQLFEILFNRDHKYENDGLPALYIRGEETKFIEACRAKEKSYYLGTVISIDWEQYAGEDDYNTWLAKIKPGLERVNSSEVIMMNWPSDWPKNKSGLKLGANNNYDFGDTPEPEAQVEIIEYNNREDYKAKMQGAEKYVKFSRNYREDAGIWKSWFAFIRKDAEKKLKSDECNEFQFLIEPSQAHGKAVLICFTKGQFRDYLATKEGDSEAIIKNKDGDEVYQFYLTYEDKGRRLFDDKYAENKVKEFEI